MRILFISPPFGEKGQKSKGLPIGPPVLEYLAGLTGEVRPEAEVRLLDANREDLDPASVDADLIGITVLTPQAPWAYRTADELRKNGYRVVLGGMHVTALPDEASGHADALVLGEAESVWADVLRDFEAGSLKSIYKGSQLALEGLPEPRTDLWNQSYVYGYFQTSRGCPYDCSFCSVHKFFGGTVRLRPVDEVVREIAVSRRRLFWGLDDNIWGTDVDRSIELYREMALNLRFKWWFGSGDLVSIDHPRSDEMLKYAQAAGLTAVLVGWESNNPLSLKEFRAEGKQGMKRRDSIKKIRDAGIEVMLFIMTGGRQDRMEDYDGILRLCDELKVSAHPVMTTPFPGTDLYEEYRPHLIGGLDWDMYDGNHAVYEHDTISVHDRESALIKLRSDMFTIPRILGRIGQISRRGFPMSHVTSWMIQYPQGRAFREYARSRNI